MNIIYKQRHQGKTTELIKNCFEVDGLIITSDYKSKRYILEIAQKMNIKIKEPEVFFDFMYNRKFGMFRQKLFIDNLELCLQSIISEHEIDTIVLNKED
jgi:hypothetical protein